MSRFPWHSLFRRWAAKLALAVMASIAGLLLVEIGVRWLLPHYHPQAQIAFHPGPSGTHLGRLGATLRLANTKGDFDVSVTFNALGLRDSKDLRQARPGAWFAVGDSFTMGWGVTEDERFSNLLEEQLGQPVFNVAIPTDLRGYGRLIAYAESQGIKVSRLILGICMENDLRDYRSAETAAPTRARPSAGTSRSRARQWLRTHSAAFLAACHELQKVPALRRGLENVGLARDGEQWANPHVLDEAMLTSCRDEVLRLTNGREAVVLLIPARGLWLGTNQATERRVHARFAALLRDAGLRVADPKPSFDKSGQPLGYYFKADPHWNSGGHQSAAAAITETLAAQRSANSP